jgi:molybdopterin-guanine dinucleotide biosynthesis protein A
MEKFLSEGRVKMGDFLGSIPHHEIPEEVLKTADPDLKSFINLNTWEDLLNQR